MDTLIGYTGFLAASIWVLAAMLLLARPYIDGYRYKTRVPGFFFVLGFGLSFIVLEGHSLPGRDEISLALVGWAIVALVVIPALHFCWTVFPESFPEFFALDEERPR